MKPHARSLIALFVLSIGLAALAVSCSHMVPSGGTPGTMSARFRGAMPAMPKASALPTPSYPGAGEPRLVATPDGAVLMTWLEPRGIAGGRTGHALRLASLKGGKWSPVLTVAEGDSFFVNWADFPIVAPFGEHGIAVAWLWKHGADTYAYQARIAVSADGGGVWTPPIVLHEDRVGTEHGFLSLFEQGNGVRAVWLDGHNFGPKVEEGMADMTLHTRYVSSNGTLGREQEIDDRVCDCCQTAAVMSGDDVVVAYRDRDPDEIRDISVVRLDGGKWSAPAAVHADRWKMPGCPVNGPALAARGKNLAIAWYTGANDVPKVHLAFSHDGGKKFGPPLRLDEGNALGRVGIAMIDDSTAAVSWIEGTKTQAQVRARFVREGGRPGPATTIARIPGARASGVPQMVRDGNRLVFAWTEPGKPAKVKLAAVRLPI